MARRRLASFLLSASVAPFALCLSGQNSTYTNPILPGFHPDPSCILVEQWDKTFFCASSSFLAFPGIPIHASKDLRHWTLIGNVLNRPDQLPGLANTSRQTSGIWAPTIRYHSNTFYIVTTLVHDDRDAFDPARWDNVIFSSKDPYDDAAWSDAVHFAFEGYDTSPFWDDDGQVYMTGSHAYKVRPGIDQMAINLHTGETGEPVNIWNGTGGLAPEGPHVYKKDGLYYLMIAEGGTGLNHMETIARSQSANGPYETYQANPILSNANTTEYFQTVGHVDLFQDTAGRWWGVALATRSGPGFLTYPMGRETVLFPVTWNKGEWPALSQARGQIIGWPFPSANGAIAEAGPLISSPDVVDFAPGTALPPHFLHWRFPRADAYTISPSEHEHTLRLKASRLNLTAYDGQNATEGQTLLARRQVDTLFTFSVDMTFSPRQEEEEAGVTVFLTQNHHMDLGIVLLPSQNDSVASSPALRPHFRFRATSYVAVPDPVVVPVPEGWMDQTLRLEIKAANLTHYSFSAAPTAHQSQMMTVGYGAGSVVSWGFTVGVYATTNGGNGSTDAYVSRWRYQGQGQIID
ncbi:xylosidase : arabinofuranosidase [Diplodia corticola]|uniref:Xylosidase: arabinofuranosidase n=1 Tax=Diplodia corticola TaxID=236234 RepID=A0A1J9SIM1_9PEZI|nr:xylosidase : arabinofuranosidase [Diplodia corticola]OJD40207.1 xylosidase : arabinofuranosidase [Diplodia corticola]